MCIETLLSNIKDSLDEVFPPHKQSRKQVKRYRKPWIDAEILELTDKKDRCYKIYLANKTSTNWENYRSVRNQVSHKKEKSHENYHIHLFVSTSGKDLKAH